jgi:hypothetical protein
MLGKMKYILLIASLTLFNLATNAQTSKIDTSNSYRWNGTQWNLSYRFIYGYNQDCQQVTQLTQQWNSITSTWKNLYLYTTSYVNVSLIKEGISQQWDSSTNSWVNYFKAVYSYDNLNKLQLRVFESWQNNTWVPGSQSTYLYNLHGFLDSVLEQQVSPLKNATLITYYYNADGTANHFNYQLWTDSIWTYVYNNKYTYNSDQTLASTVYQSWDANTSTWRDHDSITYTYNSEKQVILELDRFWQRTTGQWLYLQQRIYDYDINGLSSRSTIQDWDGTQWVNNSQSRSQSSFSCILPLHLISFTGIKNKNIVTLNWQTAEEINTSHFVIQRSVDGVNFSNVGNVKAKGNSRQFYSFADNVDNIKGNKVYYRLQMMDKDGKYTVSKIISLTLDFFAGSLKIYPNPVKDQLYVLFNAESPCNGILRILNASGTIIHTETVSTSANVINVSVSRMAKGVYYVQLITNEGIQRTTFVKD